MIILAIVVVLVAGIVVGLLIGRSGNAANKQTGAPAGQSDKTSTTDVKSLVSYTLPDGWNQGTCSGTPDTVYITPSGTSLSCDSDPSAPIKMYVDAGNTTDCAQLKPASNQDIKKHTCISLYINGHKSLKALTEYAAGSTYKTDTTIAEYYIDTGKGVVALKYTYTSSNDFQAGFDELAKSVRVKS